MCEPVDPLALLKRIPMAVYSLRETVGKPGSCEREIIDRVWRSVQADVDRCVEAWTEDRVRKVNP